MAAPALKRRPWTFYCLASLFVAYVLYLYGPMLCIFLLSFQGSQGGLVFPMRGHGLFWFFRLLNGESSGDISGAIERSVPLALIVMVITVAMALFGGMAFRKPFRGSGALFYLTIASLVAPGYVLGIGIGLMFQLLGIDTAWYSSALGAQLTWTLPFGLLIMFAVFGRLSPAYDEAARDMGASRTQTLWLVIVPIILPGVIAVALFGFTLSYDEFARTLQTTGSSNTLPIEIWSMTQNVTSPSIYALGTLTTAFSFLVIGASLLTVVLLQRKRSRRATVDA